MNGEQSPEEPEPFALYDCSLAQLATGRSCTNLRELQDAIQSVPESVLEHHMRHCALTDYFELYEFPNDFARWCWDGLGDRALAEQLSLIDPYQHASGPALREALTNVIEERLWGAERVPWCRTGLELHLMSSKLIAYDTGQRYSTMAALAEALPQMSVRSLFFHVHEAHSRRGAVSDDFSTWLERIGADPTLVAKLRAVDFYFLNLSQLRREFMDIFKQFMLEPSVVIKGAA